jgi:hypothetical protein
VFCWLVTPFFFIPYLEISPKIQLTCTLGISHLRRFSHRAEYHSLWSTLRFQLVLSPFQLGCLKMACTVNLPIYGYIMIYIYIWHVDNSWSFIRGKKCQVTLIHHNPIVSLFIIIISHDTLIHYISNAKCILGVTWIPRRDDRQDAKVWPHCSPVFQGPASGGKGKKRCLQSLVGWFCYTCEIVEI